MTAFKGIWTQPFWKAVSAEFLAMLIFVLLSLGSTIRWNGKDQPMDLVLVSLCFGLSIATMVQCFGHISGGHVNPAVTAAMVCTRKLSLAKGLFYVVAQCLGAITGAGILYLITPSSVAGGLGVTKLSAGHGLLVEIFITFQLVLTIFATCDPKREDLKGSSALAIGFSVAIGHMFAIDYTSSSMNPARSFGPAVIMGKWENHWVICSNNNNNNNNPFLLKLFLKIPCYSSNINNNNNKISLIGRLSRREDVPRRCTVGSGPEQGGNGQGEVRGGKGARRG
uniref:Aquaporin-4 n=1 Tax=Callorhinchus milii TaxID=7868 RepID=A0A4W3HBS1_CALMI